jgi:hypothetical protein
MKLLKFVCLILLITGCQSDEPPIITSNILSDVLNNSSFEVGAVIACASSDIDTADQANIYFYPQDNASNFRLYQTESLTVNPNDFSNYTIVEDLDFPIFNGFLRQFSRILVEDKWYIVTFNIGNEIKVSNPIRTKLFSKPTVFSQDIFINQESPQMPIFSWETNIGDDNAIYFHIVSDLQNNVFSATYTTERNFQYYNTSNVVLNVTEGNPPDLVLGLNYNFSLMAVSEDNWVNALTLNMNFIVE